MKIHQESPYQPFHLQVDNHKKEVYGTPISHVLFLIFYFLDII
jgi:hypothetical protein